VSVNKSVLKSIAVLSCVSVLCVAFAGKGVMRFRGFRFLEPEAILIDSPDKEIKLKYPLKEREGDFVSDKPNDPFYLPDPAAIVQDVEYDPETGMYVLTEKVAGQNVRPPVYMTYEDYLSFTEKQERDQYWKERQSAINLIEDKTLIPPIQVKKQFFDKLFGGSKIEIRPQGNVELTLGGNTQFTNNPEYTYSQP
jgi:hypothetical protein